LNLRGVSALNRNDPDAARHYFEQAYKLNPTDAFTLNNMGYLSELDGDRETADDFYARARQAEGAQNRVTMSTQRSVEGMRMGIVADVNDQKVENKIEALAEARRAQGGPAPQLMRRNGTAVTEPEVPAAPPGSQQPLPPQQQPGQEPEPQLTPRAPSPYSATPPQLPAPQLPQTGQPQGQPQSQPQNLPQTAPPTETQPPPQ
jgi:tetratricopeptide (TPR) repeat protein